MDKSIITWVNVYKQMPEDSKHVLVYNEHNKCYYIVYRKDGNWFHMMGVDSYTNFPIYHWAYLPETTD